MQKKIKWSLFHEPAELFIRTAEHFEQEINRLTGNKYKLEILKLEDYNDKYNNGEPCDPLKELQEDKVQMSQLYVNSIAGSDATDFYALCLPFLFDSHDHCTRVLEGNIGDELMTHLHDKLNIKGLSFTYSGGYKCMACDTPVKSVEDFKNLTYKSKRIPVWTAMFDALGMTPTDHKPNVTQTTFPRYECEAEAGQNFVADTQHSMYLTTIMMNDSFWNNLSAEDQMHFTTAAKLCARAERAKSVADAEEIKTSGTRQDALGIEDITKFTDAEVLKLREKLEPVTEQFAKYFSNNLVDRIRKS